jgi:hypothetical protein
LQLRAEQYVTREVTLFLLKQYSEMKSECWCTMENSENGKPAGPASS